MRVRVLVYMAAPYGLLRAEHDIIFTRGQSHVDRQLAGNSFVDIASEIHLRENSVSDSKPPRPRGAGDGQAARTGSNPRPAQKLQQIVLTR